jgi:hypothetical protein
MSRTPTPIQLLILSCRCILAGSTPARSRISGSLRRQRGRARRRERLVEIAEDVVDVLDAD